MPWRAWLSHQHAAPSFSDAVFAHCIRARIREKMSTPGHQLAAEQIWFARALAASPLHTCDSARRSCIALKYIKQSGANANRYIVARGWQGANKTVKIKNSDSAYFLFLIPFLILLISRVDGVTRADEAATLPQLTRATPRFATTFPSAHGCFVPEAPSAKQTTPKR